MILALLAAPPATPGDDVVSWALSSLKWAVEQFHDKNYMPAVGMLIMLLVFVFQKFLEGKVSKSALPYVSAGVGVIAAVGTNLLGLALGYSKADWIGAILSGLTAGAAASGFWSMIGKHLVAKVTGQPETVAPTEQEAPTLQEPTDVK